ncbi:hypothetical protein TRIUR3_13363 [Triticum urartu]|uniref:Uncharacterized protein n=2 Tax=Triticum urartu TaxID=4572 RepID=M7ZRV9_TRIUA|nr:hypothetical protein TRIUR3_13363 [Triticum urartu]
MPQYRWNGTLIHVNFHVDSGPDRLPLPYQQHDHQNSITYADLRFTAGQTGDYIQMQQLEASWPGTVQSTNRGFTAIQFVAESLFNFPMEKGNYHDSDTEQGLPDNQKLLWHKFTLPPKPQQNLMPANEPNRPHAHTPTFKTFQVLLGHS